MCRQASRRARRAGPPVPLGKNAQSAVPPNVTLTRYASVLQVCENHGGMRNCRRVRSGKGGGPRQDVTLLARSGPRAFLSRKAPRRPRRSGGCASARPSRAFALSGIAFGRQKTCAPQTDSARRRNEHPVSARSSAVEPWVQDGAGAGESVNLRGSADSRVYLDPAGSCCPRPVLSEATGGQDEG